MEGITVDKSELMVTAGSIVGVLVLLVFYLSAVSSHFAASRS